MAELPSTDFGLELKVLSSPRGLANLDRTHLNLLKLGFVFPPVFMYGET